MSVLAVTATAVGVFLGLSNVPQAIKIFQNKSAKDISLTTYLIATFGSLVWILYGIEIDSIPIIIPNVLGFGSSVLVLIGYYLYRNPQKKK